MFKRKLALGMAVAMAVSALAACGNETQKESVSSGNKETISSDTVASEETPVVEEITYPEEISIFAGMGASAIAKGFTSYNDAYWAQALEEITGTHVEWQHFSSDVSAEKFNLMIASQEYTDAIINQWIKVEGGPERFVEDGVLIELTDLIPECMPNFNAYLEEHPEVKRQIQNVDGQIIYIPIIRDDVAQCIFTGPLVRTDWLEKLGLEVPQNTDDLYKVLKAFKEQDPNGNGEADEIPMSGVSFRNNNYGIGNLLWGFDTHYSFYVDNGEVVWGPAEDKFAEGLAYIAKLFDEDLIDVDYLLNDRTAMDSKALADRVGFLYTYQPTKYFNNADFNDGTKKMTGIPHLTTADSASRMSFNSDYINQIVATSIAVTTDCEDPKGLLRWLDTIFSEEGIILMNYGKEGTHFEYVDGKPFIDFANMSAEEQLQLKADTMLMDSAFPTLQQKEAVNSYSAWGKEAIEIWAADVDTSGVLPTLSFTAEESDQITDALTELETYADTQINKVVIGEISMDEWSGIVEKFHKMGLDKILEVYNAAYQRYLSK